VLAIIVISSLVASGNSENCGIFEGKIGGIYNLSPLTRPAKSPYFILGEGNAVPVYSYYWNFCENLSGEPPIVDHDLPKPAAVVQTDRGNYFGVMSLGSKNTTKISELSYGVIRMHLVNDYDHFSQRCADEEGTLWKIQRQTFIDVACDPTSEEGTNFRVAEPATCQYYIFMQHKAACPLKY